VAALVWWQAPRRPVLDGALLMVGAALLVATPGASWYALLLLALAAQAERPEWLGVVYAPTVVYLGHRLSAPLHPLGPLAFGAGAIVMVAAEMLLRRQRFTWATAPVAAARDWAGWYAVTAGLASGSLRRPGGSPRDEAKTG
jgi:hypothetical protein